MLEVVVPWVRYLHITLGTVGLALFWLPVVLPKGGAGHVRFGRGFVWICYAVLASAALSVALHMIRFSLAGVGPRDAPAEFSLYVFLGSLTITTLAIVTHGLGAVRAKTDTPSLRTVWRVIVLAGSILAAAGLVVYAAWLRPPNTAVLLVVSAFGFLAGYDGLKHMWRPRATVQEWRYQHLNGMLGVGIAFYTAFAAFGARRLLDIQVLEGSPISVVPWVIPALVGVPLTLYWKRRVFREPSAIGDVT